MEEAARHRCRPHRRSAISTATARTSSSPISARPGIFARFNNAGAFVKLHTSTSQALAVGDLDGNGRDELIADRGSTGLWVRRLNPQNVAAWVKLHSASPTHIATGDLDGNGKDELIVANLGASGVFVRYNNAGAFVKKQASAIQGLATGDLDGNGKDEVIADFGSLGLRAFYNNAAPWVKLDTRNPTNAIAADLDSNGKGEVVADFGATGLFVRFNNTGAFRQLRRLALAGDCGGRVRLKPPHPRAAWRELASPPADLTSREARVADLIWLTGEHRLAALQVAANGGVEFQPDGKLKGLTGGIRFTRARQQVRARRPVGLVVDEPPIAG